MPYAIASNTVEVDGRKVHYLRAGAGEPLVVLHGGANGADTWRKNAAELASRHTVYIPDLPGFGYSEPLGVEFDCSRFVDFVDAFAESLGLTGFRMNIALAGKVASAKGQTMVLRDQLCELMVPTLVVWGSRDRMVPLRHAYEAARLIPECQIQVLEGGHSIHRQRLKEFSAALTGFLEGKRADA